VLLLPSPLRISHKSALPTSGWLKGRTSRGAAAPGAWLHAAPSPHPQKSRFQNSFELLEFRQNHPERNVRTVQESHPITIMAIYTCGCHAATQIEMCSLLDRNASC
jgi:hypothetical protein